MASEAQQSAKRPVTPLAGPYGHPFHPVLVTIPIGAWVCSMIFDIVSQRADNPEVYSRGAYVLIAIGLAGAAAAAVFGLLDLLAIPRGTEAFRTGLIHMGLNAVTLTLFAVGLALRHGSKWAEGTDRAHMMISGVALAALGVSGWLGGKLAYRYGVRVADEATQAEGF